MDTAYIKQATITNAMIQELTTDKLIVAGTANIWEAIINIGKISNAYIDDVIQSTSYVPGPGGTGWKIDKAGTITGQGIVVENGAITNAKIEDLAVTTGKIGDLQVSTLKIGNNAVTVPVSAYTIGETEFGLSEVAIQSAVITSHGQPIQIIASQYVKPGNDGGGFLVPFRLTIKRDGTIIWQGSYSLASAPITIALSDQPVVGTYTYTIYGNCSSEPVLTDAGAGLRSLLLMEVQK
jgi:hypothetical protein